MAEPFPSFEVLMQSYFTDLRVKNWSEQTISRRKHSLLRFTRWIQTRGCHSLQEVTPEIAEAYQRSLYHLGNLRTRKPLRFATQVSYLIAMTHWLQWACLKKLLPYNPAVNLDLPKEEKRLPAAYLTLDEVERLINQPDVETKLGVRDRTMLEVLYSTAMRRAELLNLTPYDIDRERRLIVVRQGKGKKDRVVPIGVRALEWLTRYQQEVRPWIAAGYASRVRMRIVPTDRLFLGNSGNVMKHGTFSVMVRKYLRSAGINKPGSCHILRHTAATLMLENGADLRSLQTLLGHQSLNTTQIYTHITIDRLRQVHDQTHPAKPDIKPKRLES